MGGRRTSKQARRTLHDAPSDAIRSDTANRNVVLVAGFIERDHAGQVGLFDSCGRLEAVDVGVDSVSFFSGRVLIGKKVREARRVRVRDLRLEKLCE